MNLDVSQRRNFLENLEGFVLRNAHPPHSGIDFEVDGHRRAAHHIIEALGFFKSGNRRNETALSDCWSFFRQRRTEDNDWMLKLGAQLSRFLQIRDAEQLRVIGKRLGHADQAVPVTVRFYDRQHLGRPDPLAHNFRVVA